MKFISVKISLFNFEAHSIVTLYSLSDEELGRSSDLLLVLLLLQFCPLKSDDKILKLSLLGAAWSDSILAGGAPVTDF